MFESELAHLPPSAHAKIHDLLTPWLIHLEGIVLPDNFSASMVKVFAASEFVSEHCERSPEILLNLIHSGDLFTPYTPSTYSEKLASLTPDTDEALMTLLRHFRRREMLSLIHI